MKFAKKTVEKLVMAYCLEKQTIRKKAGPFQILLKDDGLRNSAGQMNGGTDRLCRSAGSTYFYERR